MDSEGISKAVGPRDELLRVRCSRSELERWSEAAAAAEVTLSEYVRGAIEARVSRRKRASSEPSALDEFLERYGPSA